MQRAYEGIDQMLQARDLGSVSYDVTVEAFNHRHLDGPRVNLTACLLFPEPLYIKIETTDVEALLSRVADELRARRVQGAPPDLRIVVPVVLPPAA